MMRFFTGVEIYVSHKQACDLMSPSSVLQAKLFEQKNHMLNLIHHMQSQGHHMPN